MRSRIVLAAADGESNTDMAARMGISRNTVKRWRNRFVELRCDGLLDEPRPGRPRVVGDEQIKAVDASGPKSARMVLQDPTVEVAVLETARGGILREGLAFDRCDVGIVLNVCDVAPVRPNWNHVFMWSLSQPGA